jgi:MFS family permease
MKASSLLRDRDFAMLAGAIGVSSLGDWLAAVPLMLRIQQMTDSGIAVSGLLICLWAPIVILAGHVGMVVDRVETKRLFAVVSVGQAGVAVALAFVDSVAAILVLAALLGTGFAVAQAGEFALVPTVAGAGREHEANGYVESSRNFGLVLGPFIGGVVSGAGGTDVALFVNAGTFVLLAAVVWSLRVERVAARAAEGERARARDGIMQLVRDPTLALAMVVAFVSLLFMSASIPADLFFVKHDLDLGDFWFGLVYSSWTVGMLLGSLVLAKRAPVRLLVVAAFAAVSVQGLGKALTPLWLVFWFMLACYFGAGIGHGIKNVSFRTLIHREVPPSFHGRAFAAYNGLRNGAELVALAAGGLLVSAVGARATLGLAGGISAVAGVIGLALLSRLGATRPVEPVASPSLE